MKVFEELSKADKFEIPLFMHHPTLKKRKKRTIKLMPKILKIRKQAKVFINFDLYEYHSISHEKYTRYWKSKLNINSK